MEAGIGKNGSNPASLLFAAMETVPSASAVSSLVACQTTQLHNLAFCLSATDRRSSISSNPCNRPKGYADSLRDGENCRGSYRFGSQAAKKSSVG